MTEAAEAALVIRGLARLTPAAAAAVATAVEALVHCNGGGNCCGCLAALTKEVGGFPFDGCLAVATAGIPLVSAVDDEDDDDDDVALSALLP